ncbi:hypothetical protein [Pseudorhodoplanes sp.]|uniref:hypothetical protein n=1 Tax=Pseudorhodoplanes sp. TaxID=1934341 RepID=UPI002C6DBF95|nr:hypothetical protein [Pseudorhodoplanes sp.]HWV52309.1 hypothetical protein [Pseudorhodoplanes sp.]
MTKTRTKAIAGLTAATLALSTVGAVPSFAAGTSQNTAQTATTAQATEFSARQRYYRGNGNAAAAAAFAAIVGGIATYAAAREYRKAQERAYYAPYGYGYQPYPYYGGYRHW